MLYAGALGVICGTTVVTLLFFALATRYIPVLFSQIDQCANSSPQRRANRQETSSSAQSEIEQFQYAPIITTKRQRVVRTITLLPGAQDDRIRLKLQHASLDVAQYEALSYVWGPTEPSTRIWIEDRYLEVGPNLDGALKQLRRSESRRTLWIDRICIDQSNLREREQQVRLMGDIYRGATRVIVWLGAGDDQTTLAIRIIRDLRTQMVLQAHKNGDPYVTGRKDHNISYPAADSPEHSAINQLLQNPWFARVWTLQEIVLSKAATVQCGSESIEWQALQMFLTGSVAWKQGPNAEDTLLGDASANARLMNVANASYWKIFEEDSDLQYSMISFMPLIHQMRSYGATDPRDRVYALLSIAIDAKNSDLRPDYSKSVVEVYAAAAKWIIKEQKDLAILSLVEPKDSLDLVSWVPDFRYWDVWNSAHLPPIIQRKTQPMWWASASARMDLVDEPLLQLTVRGLRIGRIIKRTQPPGNLTGTVALGRRVWNGGEWQVFAQQGAVEGRYVPTQESIDLAYERLRVWDAFAFGQARKPKQKPPEKLPSFDPTTQSYNPKDGKIRGPTDDIARRVLNTTTRKRMFWTDTGYLGIAHKRLDINDEVFVLMGADCPFVLRKQGDNRYALVAEAYVHGVMDGELLSTAADKSTSRDGEASSPSSDWSSDWFEGSSDMFWRDLPFKTVEIVLV